MKKLLTTILLFASLAASACWFTEANFNATYIAGVNNFFAHYIEATRSGRHRTLNRADRLPTDTCGSK